VCYTFEEEIVQLALALTSLYTYTCCNKQWAFWKMKEDQYIPGKKVCVCVCVSLMAFPNWKVTHVTCPSSDWVFPNIGKERKNERKKEVRENNTYSHSSICSTLDRVWWISSLFTISLSYGCYKCVCVSFVLYPNQLYNFLSQRNNSPNDLHERYQINIDISKWIKVK